MSLYQNPCNKHREKEGRRGEREREISSFSDITRKMEEKIFSGCKWD